MSLTVAGPDTDASGARVLIPPNRQGLDARSTRGPARRVTMIAALVAADAGAAAAAGVGGSIVGGSGPLGVWEALALPILACLALAAAGLYGGDGPGPAERLRLRTYGVLVLSSGCLVFSAGLGVMPTRAIGIVTTGILLLVIGFYAEVTLRRLLIRRGLWGARTAIVGTDACATALADTLLAQPELGLRPIAFVAAPSAGVPRQGPVELPVIGSIGEAMRRAEIEVAVVCSSSDPVLNDLARPGPLPFPRVVVAQQTRDLQTLWTQTRTLGSVLGLELRRDLYGRRHLRIKRCLDTVLASPAVLVTAPLIAVLALVVKLVDPGPAFYVQQRVGRNGKPIRVLKLRSMYADAERRLCDHLAADARARDEWGRFFKLTHDPRILPIIGRFIRRTSLDELPQLWNVVRGEMSLVGPRPFPAYHTASFDDRFQALRQSVPPGLTGLWQVSGRSSGDLAVQQAQDTFYIRNWSLWLDFYILLVTLPAVSSGAGAR